MESPKGIFTEKQPKDEVVEIKEAIKWVLGYLLQHKLNLHFEHLVSYSVPPFFFHPHPSFPFVLPSNLMLNPSFHARRSLTRE